VMVRASNGHAGSQSKHSGDVSSRDRWNREWSFLHGRMDCLVTEYLFKNCKPLVLLCPGSSDQTVVIASDPCTYVIHLDHRNSVVRVRVGVDPACVLFSSTRQIVTRLDYINISPQLQLCKCPNLLGHRKVNEDLLTTATDYHDTQIA
jgi:hypothetical protein